MITTSDWPTSQKKSHSPMKHLKLWIEDHETKFDPFLLTRYKPNFRFSMKFDDLPKLILELLINDATVRWLMNVDSSL